ncbi:phage antirepressor KilAC domain-containing protein [Veronia pacifica]|uniref:Bro-N domain-containing protein n=1 Tax=Veronia pacifica TaxID=1080227 RepID=A0A1C3ELA0_9GAMM|nr:phage antirepressor [Veronia pacifica]ODA34004.1 hypothetical protein A8L45_08130 [Veronia pacifica]
MNVIPFQFQNAEIRVIDDDGNPWFIAKDIADILGYSNTSKAVSTHCKKIKTCPTEMGGQVRYVQIIPERDVYRLIMRSKLPEAEKFEEWVVDDVLPSIRKTGSYSPAGQMKLSRMDLINLAMEAEEENIRLKAKVEADHPKVEAFHRIACTQGSMCITNAAKDLQMRPKDLFNWLSERKWIYRRTENRNWMAYQDKIQRGLLEHKVTTVNNGEFERTVDQVRVTSKGLAILAEQLSPMMPTNLALLPR